MGCLRSGADCGETSHVRGLGGSRVEWDLKSYSSYFLRSLISSVHRNDQWKVHNWNRKEFSLSQIEDCSKGDSVSIVLRNCSAEACHPAHYSTSSKQRTYTSTWQGVFLQGFKRDRLHTQRARRQLPGDWEGSLISQRVLTLMPWGGSYSSLSSKQMLFTSLVKEDILWGFRSHKV